MGPERPKSPGNAPHLSPAVGSCTAARYNTIDDLFDDPHLQDVAFFRDSTHPSEGRIRQTKVANNFSGGNRSEPLHAPLKGEHTITLLSEAGYSASEIQIMIANGSVFAR